MKVDIPALLGPGYEPLPGNHERKQMSIATLVCLIVVCVMSGIILIPVVLYGLVMIVVMVIAAFKG